MNSKLKEKILKDLEFSFKNRNISRVETLRMLMSAVHNKEIEKKGKLNISDLSEEEVLEAVVKEAKKRKEAIDFYIKGGRNDLAEKEKGELKILEEYLPAQMGEAEVRKVVKEILNSLGGIRDFGGAMSEVMKKLKGQADAKIISSVVKEEISDAGE
ncbi:MAG: GatB/YqeY domain-containing protein [Patescibacteria group bacterium]|nr:GatB/YqeY domain-containing protein [Patescibacteria group bacterium]